jgi:hypothetical protein
MEYLEILENKEKLVNLAHRVQEATGKFAADNDQQIYTMYLLTHVTENSPHANYSTTMLINNKDDNALVHTMVALVQALDGVQLLDLLKTIIHDKEQDNEKHKKS